MLPRRGGGGKTKQVIISVKAGHTGRHHVHELRGVIEREGAAIDALIFMEAPTRPMREEAASAGFYHSDAWNRDNRRLQLLTIKDLEKLAAKQRQRWPGDELPEEWRFPGLIPVGEGQGP